MVKIIVQSLLVLIHILNDVSKLHLLLHIIISINSSVCNALLIRYCTIFSKYLLSLFRELLYFLTNLLLLKGNRGINVLLFILVNLVVNLLELILNSFLLIHEMEVHLLQFVIPLLCFYFLLLFNI